jgi:hypothetical protein
MRIFYAIYAVILLATSASPAKAFCLFSCTPSETDAKAVFLHILPNVIRNSPYNLTSFEKTNGVEQEALGQKIYRLSFKAAIQLPSGANEDCKPQMVFYPCSGSPRQFWPPGSIVNFSDTFTFQKTERGWQGPDGNLY